MPVLPGKPAFFRAESLMPAPGVLVNRSAALRTETGWHGINEFPAHRFHPFRVCSFSFIQPSVLLPAGFRSSCRFHVAPYSYFAEYRVQNAEKFKIHPKRDGLLPEAFPAVSCCALSLEDSHMGFVPANLECLSATDRRQQKRPETADSQGLLLWLPFTCLPVFSAWPQI